MTSFENAEAIFRGDVALSSDINEHLPTLRNLASQCTRVVEMGCWRGLSAFALLLGLHDSGELFRELEIIDIDAGYLQAVEDKLRPFIGSVILKTRNASTLEIDIDPTDLLFIDTWHVYDQLKAELERHGNQAQKFIAMHDTVSFGVVGENGESPGLMDAVEEFLEDNPHWRIMHHYENNNGLMVLERE